MPDPAQSLEIQSVLEETRARSENQDAPLIDFLAGDPLAFLESLENLQQSEMAASPAVKSNLGAVAGRLQVMLSINRLRSRITRILDEGGNAIAGADRRKINRHLTNRLDAAYALLTRDPDLDKRRP